MLATVAVVSDAMDRASGNPNDEIGASMLQKATLRFCQVIHAKQDALSRVLGLLLYEV